MNGKSRDAQKGFIKLDEFRLEVAALVCDDDSTGEREIAVEP